MKKRRWHRQNYLLATVGILFLIAMAMSFQINEWLMRSFAWDH